MVYTTVVLWLGDELGFIIPSPLIDYYHLTEGDSIFWHVTERGVFITLSDPSRQGAVDARAKMVPGTPNADNKNSV